MLASGVTYADLLNKVATSFQVSQALMQAMLDLTGEVLFTLPDDDAQDYARQYAASQGIRDPKYAGGLLWPEANYMAAGWWLATRRQAYVGEWGVVASFFTDGPVGEMQARRVARLYYPQRYRSWS